MRERLSINPLNPQESLRQRSESPSPAIRNFLFTMLAGDALNGNAGQGRRKIGCGIQRLKIPQGYGVFAAAGG
ncbi:MAG: hypothetical protein LBU32_08885 [Clostridiales bacterium]|nr:hypothetical protein [Clostridiales bacterium]